MSSMIFKKQWLHSKPLSKLPMTNRCPLLGAWALTLPKKQPNHEEQPRVILKTFCFVDFFASYESQIKFFTFFNNPIKVDFERGLRWSQNKSYHFHWGFWSQLAPSMDGDHLIQVVNTLCIVLFSQPVTNHRGWLMTLKKSINK